MAVTSIELSISFAIIMIVFSLIASVASRDSGYLTASASLEGTGRIDKITTGQGACGIAVNSREDVLYVSNYKANSLAVINGSTSSVIGKREVPLVPCGLAIDPARNVVYVVSEKGNGIYSIDASSLTLMDKFDVDKPYEVVFNAGTGTLYVTSDADDRVCGIDVAEKEVTSIFEIADPCAVTTSDDNIIYVSSKSTGKVYLIDGITDKVITSIQVGQGPRGMAFNPKTNTLLVANTGSDSVAVIDTARNEVISTIEVDMAPTRIAVDPNTNIAYVISSNRSSLSFLDASTNSVIRSVPVQNPQEVAVDPDKNLVYVSNRNSDLVYVISGYGDESSSASLPFSVVITVVGIAAGGGLFALVWHRIRGHRTRREGDSHTDDGH